MNKVESSLQCTEVRMMYAALGLIKDDCFIVNDIHFEIAHFVKNINISN